MTLARADSRPPATVGHAFPAVGRPASSAKITLPALEFRTMILNINDILSDRESTKTPVWRHVRRWKRSDS